jgi:hypothetical protein
MILFKYRNLSEYTEKLFSEKSVWLSNAAGLNDPFECNIQEIAKDWITKQVQIGKEHQLKGLYLARKMSLADGSTFFGVNKHETNKFFKKLEKKRDLESKYNFYRSFRKEATGYYPPNPLDMFKGFDKQLNNVGIFSLSEDSENQLLWAHYAQDSTGICLGFDVEENSKLSDPKHCLKVNYSDILPAFNRDGFLTEAEFYIDEMGMATSKSKISFEDPTFKLAISTKPSIWKYEKEWRYVEEISGKFPFPSTLNQIVFGLRCSKESREKYRGLAEKYLENPVHFYEIVAEKNKNSILKVKYDF